MATAVPLLAVKFQQLYLGGVVGSGTVDTYQAGTLVRQATYTSPTISLGTTNLNPVQLDAAGQASIYLDPALAYRFIVKDAAGATIADVDNFVGVDVGSAAALQLALADGATSTNGDAMVAVKRPEANAVPRTLDFYIKHSRLLMANYCDPTADTPTQIATAFANAGIDMRAGGKWLEFDPGATYNSNAEFAFCGSSGLKSLRIIGNGATLYRSSGAGNVASMDSGSNTLSNYDCEIRDLRLRGNALSTFGLYTRALQGSRVENISVVDVATAGFKVAWSVCSKFKDLSMSTNQDTFLVNAAKGLIVDQSIAGNYTADCQFENARFEGSCITDCGIEIVYGDLSNVFRGGTCEALPTGFRTLSTSNRNTITEMDFEQNTVADISIAGNGLTLRDVNASSAGSSGTTIIGATAQNTTIDGGFHRQIAHNASSLATRIKPGTKVSDSATLGITGPTAGSLPAAGIGEAWGVVKVNGSLVPTGNYPDGFYGPQTYTPAFASAGGGAQGAVTTAVGTYCLVGRLCFLQGVLNIAKGTLGAGAVSVTGLPFGSRNTANDTQFILCGEWSNITLGAGYTHLVLHIAANSNVATLFKSGTAVAAAVVNVADFADPMVLSFSGCYEIA